MPRDVDDITDEHRAIGKALREARERTGLSQSDAAAKLEVTSQTINQWESGKRCPNLSVIPTLAAVYGIAPSTLARAIFAGLEEKK